MVAHHIFINKQNRFTLSSHLFGTKNLSKNANMANIRFFSNLLQDFSILIDS